MKRSGANTYAGANGARVATALFAVIAACAGTMTSAADAAFGTLRIIEPHATATIPGSRTSAVYFGIQNSGRSEEQLLEATSPAAASVEIHEMRMDNGMMRMRAVPSVRIPPGRTVSLASGSYHVMLSDLRERLKAGDRVPLTLRFARAGVVDISVPVLP